MPKAEPPPPPPPRPDPVKLQVKCVAWKCMDFQIDARLPEYQLAHLEEIINARHGDEIQNLTLYKGPPSEATKLTPGSTDPVSSTGASCIFYDYYPPLDPFHNRPTAGEVFATNTVITLQTFENLDKPVIEPEKLTWSKTAEHDPWTARQLAAEAAEVEAKAKAEAEEAARIAAEEEAAKQAEKDARAKRAAEKKAQKLEEERIAKEEEEARLAAQAAREKEAEEKRLQALRDADPEAAARAEAELAKKAAEEEAARVKAEAEAKLANLPKRSKGQHTTYHSKSRPSLRPSGARHPSPSTTHPGRSNRTHQPGRSTPHPLPLPVHPSPLPLHVHPSPSTLPFCPPDLIPAPCTLHPAPCTLHPAPCTLHPAPSGGCIGVFLGATSKSYFGLDACTKDNPFLLVPCDKILAEIKDKGKISDMYIIQDQVGSAARDACICCCWLHWRTHTRQRHSSLLPLPTSAPELTFCHPLLTARSRRIRDPTRRKCSSASTRRKSMGTRAFACASPKRTRRISSCTLALATRCHR